MNQNEFVKTITLLEGKKISLSIAQIKECLKLFRQELAKLSDEEIIKFIRKGNKRK